VKKEHPAFFRMPDFLLKLGRRLFQSTAQWDERKWRLANFHLYFLR
jgi:hypothetical protein